MIAVTRDNFEDTLARLREFSRLSLDTETFGLRAYQGDRLFSIIIGTSGEQAFYFNWQTYEGIPPALILSGAHLQKLREQLFNDPTRTWYLQNAKFDMHMLAQEGITLAGTIHCTLSTGRLVWNEHLSYSLDSQLHRIGLKKDNGVEKYIQDKKLWTIENVPGKKTKVKNKHFDQVPYDIIVPYGLADATGTFALGEYQLKELSKMTGPLDVQNVYNNEVKLTKVLFDMERVGLKINTDFCKEAVIYENTRMREAEEEYTKLTGLKEYKASNKDFQKVFESEQDKWEYTEKGNPSFESDILRLFTSPVAKEVIKLRDAKAKMDFYTGFLYHVDRKGRVHPTFHQGGTQHGRLSSSEPNFQNLKDENEETVATEKYVVRRSIVPEQDFILVAIDYDACEYKMALDYACHMVGRETALAKQINSGFDFHQATAELASKATGLTVSRSQAKMSNFLALYSGGNKKLADGLGIPLEQAIEIRQAIKSAAPEIDILIKSVIRTAETRGYIINWLGRRCQFPDRQWAYRSPNHLIAGSCADVMKVAMNRLGEYLKNKKSRLILNVHDEIIVEVYKDEYSIVPDLKKIMDEAYPYRYVPQTTTCFWSDKSLADLEKGIPS